MRTFQIIFFIWIIALISTLGSLFFSEVMNYAPCSLCWYQRICMYPLVFISAVAVFKEDKNIIYYLMPLTILGWLLALYHNLIHWGVIPEAAAPCRQGVPCSTVYINWLGFITIPFLSFIAFTLILGFIMLLIQQYKKDAKNGKT